jgi:hypothetical protein
MEEIVVVPKKPNCCLGCLTVIMAIVFCFGSTVLALIF